MGNHHDHHDDHSTEKKPVSFTVPLIFASVIVLVIVLLVNLGDSKHECCEGGDHAQACMKDAHGKCEGKCEGECEGHGEGHGDAHHSEATEAHVGSTAVDSTATPAPAPADSTHAAPAAEGHGH